jgi:hypothetical protein
MQFLHKREHLRRGTIVVVHCSHQCNVLLTDDNNFTSYKNGRSFTHVGGGGFFKQLPARLTVPNDGYWNITIDLAGGTANITHSITFVEP